MPLGPGEVYFPAGACGEVRSGVGADAAERAALNQFLANDQWRGECRNGLRHGIGISSIGSILHYYFGRRSLVYSLGDGKQHYFQSRELGTVELDGIAEESLGLPSPQRTTDSFRGAISLRNKSGQAAVVSLDDDVIRNVPGPPVTRAQAANGLSPLPSIVRDWGVTSSGSYFGSDKSTYTPCPNPQDIRSCAGLWNRAVSPISAEVRRVIAAARAEDGAMRRRVAALMASLHPQAAADLAGFRAEDEAQAREDARIAAAQALRAAEEKAREQAIARETAAFNTSLRTLPSGALYAKADELQAAGETEKAREAYRAFISRFPSSPLSANAAQALSALSAGGAPPPPPTRAAPVPAPVARSASGTQQVSPASRPPAQPLSAQQIENCENSVRSAAETSQRMDPASSGRVTGYWIYGLFTNACAGHPRASAYMADAVRMLEQAGAPVPAGARASANSAAQPRTSGALSSAQIAECDRVIKAEQVASQGWPGDARSVSARLGRFQYDLFNGRCAGHPQAALYLRGARRMLEQGGVSVPSATPPTVARPAAAPSGTQASGGPPDRGPAFAGGQSGRRSYLTPDGQPCIRALGYRRDTVQPLADTTYGGFHFQNFCDQDIVVRARVRGEVKGIYGNGSTIFKRRGSEPGRGSITCLYKRGDRNWDCISLEEWWTP